MVQPLRVTEPSVRHANVEPTATATPLGPVRPWYRAVPIVTQSYPVSVSNSDAVSVPAAATRMVQASLLPCTPAPSVAQPFASIWQYCGPDTTDKSPAHTIAANGIAGRA